MWLRPPATLYTALLFASPMYTTLFRNSTATEMGKLRTADRQSGWTSDDRNFEDAGIIRICDVEVSRSVHSDPAGSAQGIRRGGAHRSDDTCVRDRDYPIVPCVRNVNRPVRRDGHALRVA